MVYCIIDKQWETTTYINHRCYYQTLTILYPESNIKFCPGMCLSTFTSSQGKALEYAPRAANTNSAVTKWGEQRWNWWKALLRDLAVALVLSSCCFLISTEFLKDLSGCGCVDRDEPIAPKTAHMIHFNFPLADQSCIRRCHVNKRLLKEVPEVQKAFWTPIVISYPHTLNSGSSVEEISYD